MTLKETALNSIKSNIITHSGKEYITSGANQFRALWIRDTFFSAEILYKIGLGHLVDNLIELCLKNIVDGCVPKAMDTMNTEWRVVKVCIRHSLGLPKEPDSFEGPLIIMHGDSRTSCAIDSNILLVLASFHSKKYTKKVASLLDFYQLKNGLIIQEPYSDWQDSQDRSGVTFLTNLLYYQAIKQYSDLGIKIKDKSGKVIVPDQLKNTIINTFYDKKTGIFKSHKNFYALADNLFAIKYNFIDSSNLYKNLKKSELWSSVPGFPQIPNNNNVHVQVKFGSLENYHNNIYWSWLMGFSGAISFMMKDYIEGQKMFDRLERIAYRDKCIAEIYDPTTFKIFETGTYKAECPFTWGSCFVLEMCLQKEK